MSSKGKSTHPPMPCKAFVTDGLLIRWNKSEDFSGDGDGDEKLSGDESGIRMGMGMGILVEMRVE